MELIKVNESVAISPTVEFIPMEETSDSHFMAANTVPMGLDKMSNTHTIPVFAKDNESTISHQEFIETVAFVAEQIFGGETILKPALRVSHPIKDEYQVQLASQQKSSWSMRKHSIMSVWHLP